MFLRPATDCEGANRSGRCNSVMEQRMFNVRQLVVGSLQKNLPDFALNLRCTGVAGALEAMLTGDYARPFMSSDSRATVLAAIESRLSAEGGGDRATGCRRVGNRWQRYLAGR